ncbi:MAG: hypothetical protein HXK06_01080 [Actinomyces graevenitzii]|nr:hypothetical protein [Actinomyces graevenitzii]
MKVYLLILLVAAAITYVSVPVVRHIALVTHTLTPVRSRDVHKVPVPRLGGVAMYVGMVAAIAVASHIPYLEGVFEGGSAWGVVTSGGLLCALGVVDDLFDLEWWAKLAGQALAASILAWQGVQLVSFPIAGLTIGSSGFSMVMTIFVVLTAINAVNFVDGLDGLAAGTVAIGAMAFFGYTYVLTRNTSPDSYASLAATLGAALIGICLGFLPHNFNPATIFMGDCGSMLLGLMSAATAIVVTGQIDPISISYGRALPAFLPVLLPLAMMLLPLTDMMLAVVRRVSAGKSPFHPDRMHIHHRLLSAGLTHRRVVLVMYMWTAAVVFPLAAWAFIDTRQAILALGLSLIAAFVFTGFMRKTKREEPAEKPAPKPVSKAVPKQDLPASVHPTKLPDKTAATPVVRVRTASTPVVDSSSPSAASSATAASPETDSSSAAASAAVPGAASVPSSAAASAAAPSTAAPGVAAPGAAAPGSLSAASAASATTTPAPTTPARTRRSRLKPRSTTPPWLQSAEPAPSSAPSTASAASTAASGAASNAALSASSSLSAPSTFSAPSTQSAPYFAANSPDEAIAVNPAAPLPPAAPLAAQTQMTQTPVVQTPVAQAVQQPVPAPAPGQAQPALGQPVPHSPLSTPVVPTAQAEQTQGAEPAVQTRRRRAGRHAATPVEQSLTPATPANNNPVWQAPRNPNVRYDVVPDQSLWEDEDDDDTNPTGVPAI